MTDTQAIRLTLARRRARQDQILFGAIGLISLGGAILSGYEYGRVLRLSEVLVQLGLEGIPRGIAIGWAAFGVIWLAGVIGACWMVATAGGAAKREYRV